MKLKFTSVHQCKIEIYTQEISEDMFFMQYGLWSFSSTNKKFSCKAVGLGYLDVLGLLKTLLFKASSTIS
jgi:hypothetical protein